MAGEKPDWLPVGEIPAQRQWQERQRWHEKPNAIEEACAYLDCLESVPNGTYTDVAESFGVTKTRVCQMLALLKKLPPEITDAIACTEDDRFRAFFTERRLRALTVLPEDGDKLKQFAELAAGAAMCPGSLRDSGRHQR